MVSNLSADHQRQLDELRDDDDNCRIIYNRRRRQQGPAWAREQFPLLREIFKSQTEKYAGDKGGKDYLVAKDSVKFLIKDYVFKHVDDNYEHNENGEVVRRRIPRSAIAGGGALVPYSHPRHQLQLQQQQHPFGILMQSSINTNTTGQYFVPGAFAGASLAGATIVTGGTNIQGNVVHQHGTSKEETADMKSRLTVVEDDIKKQGQDLTNQETKVKKQDKDIEDIQDEQSAQRNQIKTISKSVRKKNNMEGSRFETPAHNNYVGGLAIDPDASVGSPLLHRFDAAAATSGSFNKTTYPKEKIYGHEFSYSEKLGSSTVVEPISDMTIKEINEEVKSLTPHLFGEIDNPKDSGAFIQKSEQENETNNQQLKVGIEDKRETEIGPFKRKKVSFQMSTPSRSVENLTPTSSKPILPKSTPYPKVVTYPKEAIYGNVLDDLEIPCSCSLGQPYSAEMLEKTFEEVKDMDLYPFVSMKDTLGDKLKNTSTLPFNFMPDTKVSTKNGRFSILNKPLASLSSDSPVHVDKNKTNSECTSSTTRTKSKSGLGWGSMFSQEAAWKCSDCFVSNPMDISTCLACAAQRPNADCSEGPSENGDKKTTSLPVATVQMSGKTLPYSFIASSANNGSNDDSFNTARQSDASSDGDDDGIGIEETSFDIAEPTKTDTALMDTSLTKAPPPSNTKKALVDGNIAEPTKADTALMDTSLKKPPPPLNTKNAVPVQLALVDGNADIQTDTVLEDNIGKKNEDPSSLSTSRATASRERSGIGTANSAAARTLDGDRASSKKKDSKKKASSMKSTDVRSLPKRACKKKMSYKC